MGLEGEGSAGRGGGVDERGREVGIGYPLSTPSLKTDRYICKYLTGHVSLFVLAITTQDPDLN